MLRVQAQKILDEAASFLERGAPRMVSHNITTTCTDVHACTPQVQNILDEAASFLERGAALATWADPTASALLLLAATAGALAIAALGLHTVLAFLLCWLVRLFRPLSATGALAIAALGLHTVLAFLLCWLVSLTRPSRVSH